MDTNESSYSKSDLLGIFEYHPKIDNEIILFDINDIYSEGNALVQMIKDPRVRKYCENNLHQIDSPISIYDKVAILNDLILQSEYLPSEIPIQEVEIPEKKYIRKIFRIKNQYGKTFHRVTIPKKLLTNSTEKLITIEIQADTKKLEFSPLVLSNLLLSNTIDYFATLIDNNDGSMRVNIPSDVYGVLLNRGRLKSVIMTFIDNKINFKITERTRI